MKLQNTGLIVFPNWPRNFLWRNLLTYLRSVRRYRYFRGSSFIFERSTSFEGDVTEVRQFTHQPTLRLYVPGYYSGCRSFFVSTETIFTEMLFNVCVEGSSLESYLIIVHSMSMSGPFLCVVTDIQLASSEIDI